MLSLRTLSLFLLLLVFATGYVHHRITHRNSAPRYNASTAAAVYTPAQPAKQTQESLTVYIKSGVYPQKMVPQLRAAIPRIFQEFRIIMGPGYRPVITSANDSEDHHQKSQHYSNQAIDFRANNLQPPQARALHARLQNSLGSTYLVLLENTGSSRQHFHIQVRE